MTTTIRRSAAALLACGVLLPCEALAQVYDYDQIGAALGSAVAGVGDVTGDGSPDFLASAPRAGNGNDGGEVLLFPGGGQLRSTWSASGSGIDGVGSDVAAAGDVNGDGRPDFLIGAPGMGPNQSGAIGLWYGRVGRPTAAPGWSASGTGQFESLGESLAGLGDVNGDGYDDFGGGSSYLNQVRIWAGAAAGPAATQDWLLTGTGSFGMTFDGGDLDGDGYADVAVAAPQANASSGFVVVHRGTPTGPEAAGAWTYSTVCNQCNFGSDVAVGDTNADGYADLFVTAINHPDPFAAIGHAEGYFGAAGGPVGSPAWTGDGVTSPALYGSSIRVAGDLDADGYEDLIVGAPFHADGNGRVGGAFVYYGGPTGPSPAPDQIVAPPIAETRFGAALDGIGDFDGDGFDDFVVGAPLATFGERYEGGIYLAL